PALGRKVLSSAMAPKGAARRSLAHPGGNITGLSLLSLELTDKWLELLMGTVPNLKRVAVLGDTSQSSNVQLEGLSTAAATQPRVQSLVLGPPSTCLPLRDRAVQWLRYEPEKRPTGIVPTGWDVRSPGHRPLWQASTSP